jgi:predicted DNA-binding transcriptional regulator AlpA
MTTIPINARRDQPPPWCDTVTLAWHLCISAHTVHNWVEQRLLPAPRKRGGKLLWAWDEVDDWLRRGPQNADLDAVRIRDAVEALRQSAGNVR